MRRPHPNRDTRYDRRRCRSRSCHPTSKLSTAATATEASTAPNVESKFARESWRRTGLRARVSSVVVRIVISQTRCRLRKIPSSFARPIDLQLHHSGLVHFVVVSTLTSGPKPIENAPFPPILLDIFPSFPTLGLTEQSGMLHSVSLFASSCAPFLLVLTSDGRRGRGGGLPASLHKKGNIKCIQIGGFGNALPTSLPPSL